MKLTPGVPVASAGFSVDCCIYGSASRLGWDEPIADWCSCFVLVCIVSVTFLSAWVIRDTLHIAGRGDFAGIRPSDLFIRLVVSSFMQTMLRGLVY
jgi:hypothetical protein